jgi:hypothetical protein
MSGKRKQWSGTDLEWHHEHERQMQERFMQTGNPVQYALDSYKETLSELREACIEYHKAQDAYTRPSSVVIEAQARQVATEKPAPLTPIERKLAALGWRKVGGVWLSNAGANVRIEKWDAAVLAVAPVTQDVPLVVEVMEYATTR